MTENKIDFAVCNVCDNEYQHDLENVLQEIKNILIKKHHDYGSQNLLRHGNLGIIVRIDDKTARLSNFFENTKEFKVETEKVEDTYIDIAGYAIQGILLNRDNL